MRTVITASMLLLAHTVAIHDQITDAVGVVKQRIDFQERERTP
jgi:hypothetical protein